MTEVGGDGATYLPRLKPTDDIGVWAQHGAQRLLELLERSPAQREHAATLARSFAARFDADAAIEGYLRIYQRVLTMETALSPESALA